MLEDNGFLTLQPFFSSPEKDTNFAAVNPFYVVATGDQYHSLFASCRLHLRSHSLHETFRPHEGTSCFFSSALVGIKKFKAARAEFEYMLQLGLIRPSTSSRVSSLHKARKADTDFRSLLPLTYIH